MSGSINKSIIVGRITADPELRTTQSGISFCSFTIACDRKGSKKDGQDSSQPTSDFIRCKAWRQRADFLTTYGRKGMLVGVEGPIQTSNFTNQQGQKTYITEVLAESVQILESRRSSGSSSGSVGNETYRPQEDYDEEHTRQEVAEAYGIPEDDLPF